jgi:hypothetical protein
MLPISTYFGNSSSCLKIVSYFFSTYDCEQVWHIGCKDVKLDCSGASCSENFRPDFILVNNIFGPDVLIQIGVVTVNCQTTSSESLRYNLITVAVTPLLA